MPYFVTSTPFFGPPCLYPPLSIIYVKPCKVESPHRGMNNSCDRDIYYV